MIFLILTIVCSTSIALILKYNDSKQGTPIYLLAGNYFVAAIISLLFLIFSHESTYSIETVCFGAILAVFFVSAFFAFARAVSFAGTAISQVSSRLSVVIPILLSIVVFKEMPNYSQILGFLFTISTIYLFYLSLKNMTEIKLSFNKYFYLCAVLVGIGINDFSMKIFQHWRPGSEKPLFLFSIFTFSLIYSIIYILKKKIPFEKDVMFRGWLLGVPNVFSTFFLIEALATLPAIIVFPVTNIGIILLTAISASIIWKENLNKMGKFALILGVISIVLLGI